jgi:molybdopterin/thiamine biosynthesis adenylyltransferase
MTTEPFSYETMTTRNLGFVSAREQARLREAHVFVPGVGGMGGAAVACLARAGVGHFTIADVDRFEVSNLNRQMFATLDVVGHDKAAVTAAALGRINPGCVVDVLGGEWPRRLDDLLPRVTVAVNGCDDVRATLALMRAGERHQRSVVDAFASTLPNVYVVGPGDPRPERGFGYPTVGVPLDAVDDAMVAACKQRELEWVLTQSSTADHVQLDVAGEMVSGARPRISFAPMVWMTGCLMAYEAIRVILGRRGGPGPRGWFVNPWTGRVERPRNPLVAGARRALVRRFLARLGKQP